MATQPTLEFAENGFVERGRTLKATHVIEIVEMSHRAEFQPLLDSADGVTHLDIAVASGPSGPEVLIQPRAGDRVLPGELYVQVPGAFGAPAAFDRSGGHGLAWASPSANLQEYLQTHQFGAPSLPGGLRNGADEVDLAWTIQISALGVASSIVACQLSSAEPAVLETALSVIDRLSNVTSQSQAAGPQGGLHAFRFGFVVELALTGRLDAPPPPPAPVASEPPPPPPPPAPPAPVAPVETFEPAQPEIDSFHAETFDAQSFDPNAFDPTSFDSGSFDPGSFDAPSGLDTFAVESVEPEGEALYDMSANAWEGSTSAAGTIDARAAVAEALGRYEGKRVVIGAITDQKKLTNVLRGIAPEVEAEDMCGFVDTGARANGKSGAVFTSTAIHFTGVNGRQQYDYADIESFKLEATAVVLNGADGTKAKISTSGQSLAIAEAIVAATGLSV